jgi:hypothetical protein
MLRIIHIFLVIMLLSACSHSVVEPIKSIDIPLNQSLFTLNDILISEKDIFSLSKEQENDFFKEYEKLKNEGLEPHVALAEYLQRFKNNFTFYGETNVAQTSLDKKQGNCLSLSILTTALTRLVGLKTSYREVTSAPIFQKNNQLI